MIRVDHLTKRYGREVTMSTQQFINPGAGPLARAARLGLWALPVWAALLFAGTITHQPNWRTDLAGWSRYVTTPEFLASHLVASILGAGIGAVGMVALGAVLASRGHPRAGLWAMVTGVFANVLTAAGFGVAAFAQPAIGRDYLAGHTAQARLLVHTVVNGGWLNATAIPAEVLLVASVVVAGVAAARIASLPRAAGIGFAVSIVLFVIGGIPDNGPWQSIAAALVTASTVWIAAAAGRRGAPAPAATAGDTIPAASHPQARHDGPARVR
jgi:hypothetical protein